MVRQGDLLIVPLTRRDSAWVRLPRTPVGDSIGAHRVEGESVKVYDTQRHGRVIDAKEDFQIIDDEHAPIALRAGAYRVIC